MVLENIPYLLFALQATIDKFHNVGARYKITYKTRNKNFYRLLIIDQFGGKSYSPGFEETNRSK